jgi:hypothetical protein
LAGNPPDWTFSYVHFKERIIAKNQNTFAKRQREMEKKAKQAEKRARRTQRKEEGSLTPPEPSDDESQASAESS